MGIIKKKIKLKLKTSYKKDQAKELGFIWNSDDEIEVTTEEYAKYFYNIEGKIDFICDKCGRKFSYRAIVFKRYNGIMLCKKCIREEHTIEQTNGIYSHSSQMPEVKKKYLDTVHERYGEEFNSPTQSAEIKALQKQREMEACIKKYGKSYRCAMQAPEVKKKRKETVNKRYGYDYVMQVSEIKQKAKMTYVKNGNGITSKQQKRIHELMNGELNYVCHGYMLDVALLDKKIDIEYDGKGHDLSVILGKATREEFIKHEKIRNHVLIKDGWKIIRIVSKTDKLHNDQKMKNIIEFCVKKLEQLNIHLIYVYLDERKIVSSAFETTYELT